MFDGGTAVEHSTRKPKIERSNPAPCTGGEKVAKKARVFFTVRHFNPSLIFASKGGTHPNSSTMGRLRAFLTNFKLGIKWPSVTNALAYLQYGINYGRKIFYDACLLTVNMFM